MAKGSITIKGDGGLELVAVWDGEAVPRSPKWEIEVRKGGDPARFVADKITAELNEEGWSVQTSHGLGMLPPETWMTFAAAIYTSVTVLEEDLTLSKYKAPAGIPELEDAPAGVKF